MIRSAKAIAHITDTSPYTYKAELLPSCAVLGEMSDFLEEYFKGAYEKNFPRPISCNLKFSSQGFAYIFKLIFKAVRGESLIKIDAEFTSTALKFTVSFDTSRLNDEARSLILDTAEKSNVKASLFDGYAEIQIDFCYDFVSIFNSSIQKTVFSAFSCMFFAPPDAKDEEVLGPNRKNMP